MELLGKYRNGNYVTTILSDGTRIRETEDDEFIPAFAENMDIKICNRCDMNCKFCHEGSTPDGKLGNIMNEKFVDTLHPYQEVALGGGNVLEHPDLIPFLKKLKDRKVIANITLNQCHFEKDIETVDKLINEKLIYGLGVSLVNPTEEFIEKIKRYPNAVIHVINGIFRPSDAEMLSDKGLKILILGYKHIRRGEDWYSDDHENIVIKQMWLKDNLASMIDKFNVVSFDNLAIEQLNVKSLLSQEEWDEFYAGDDGTHTYYIDMVERKFAKSSTADFDKRYDLLDSVDYMFNKIRLEG
jgi:hypothetical protein